MKNVISSTFAVTAQKDGVDAYVLDLTNQMNSVPVDANGKVTSATTLTTVARIMKGADYVREDLGVPTQASLKIGDVTPTITNNGGLITIEWKFTTAHTLTSDRYVKTVQMVHGGKTYKADYIVRTDKTGAAYDLKPSFTEIPFVRDADYNLIPANQSIYCGYTKNQNGTITSFEGKSNAELYNIDKKYNIFYRYVNSGGTFTGWAFLKDVSGFVLSIPNNTAYSAVEFCMSSAATTGTVSDTNIIDRETVPIVKQSERGFGIVTSVQRDNFTEANWGTYGTIGHTESWGSTSSIRNGARIGDLFTVVGKATDTGNGHTLLYRCTNASGDLKGICIAHQISRAAERRNAIMLYKRAATAPTSHGISSTFYYKFSDGKLYTTSACSTSAEGNSGLNGWSQNIPANDGNPLYVIAATAYSQTNVDDIEKNEWSSPVLYNKDGMHTASVFLYIRSASTPSKPTSKSTYTFSSGVLSGSLAGWSQTVPATDGNPCWVIQATAINTAATDDIAASEWSTPKKYVVDGEGAFIIDLSNEADLIGTNSSDKTTEAQNRTTKVHMYLGTKKQTLTANPTVSLTYATSGNAVPTSVAVLASSTGKDTDEGSVTIQVKSGQTITDVIYADITAKCSSGSKTARFTLKPVKSGKDGELWQLAFDYTALSFSREDDNSLSPASQTLHVYVDKIIGDTSERKTSAVTGLRVYWGWDTKAFDSSKYQNVGAAWSVSNSEAASHTQIWFELRSSADNYASWIDRETVPINKDGKKGPGGENGNGISTVTCYRMFTRVFESPAISDSGWIPETSTNYPELSKLSKTNMFLWQKKVTTYTKTNPTYEISLVGQYETGVCANLLEDTAFASDGQLEAWTKRSEYAPKSGQSAPAESGAGVVNTSYTLDGQNSYFDKTAYSDSVIYYKEILQQPIWQYSGVKKLAYSDWYTFSFYVRGAYNGYADLHTYIYPSCVDTNQAFYVDGVKQSSTPNDGYVAWKSKITTSWVRHTVTFRTKSNFYNSSAGEYSEQQVLFRLVPTGNSYNQVYICMPKLERNTIATEWLEHTNDRMADDIQHIYVGEWSSGTTYYYGGGTGVRHVVRAKESSSGAKTYFRMKKRTTSQGYYSTREPYIDTTNWEKADYLKFVATDLMLAEEVITDKLTVSKIRSANNTFVVDANGNVTATSGTFNNIKSDKGTFTNVAINSGKIGGFDISNGRIGSGDATATGGGGNMSLSSTFFRVGDTSGYAMLGSNVFPATLGGAFTAVGRIINKRTNSATSYGFDVANYGLYIEVSGGTKNYGIQSTAAIRGSAVYGDRVKELDLSSSSLTYNIDLSQYNVFIMKRSTSGEYGVNLPDEESIKKQFGYNSLPADYSNRIFFGVRFTLICGIQYGAKKITINNVYNCNGNLVNIDMEQGDVLELLVTNYGGTFRYMQVNKQYD